LDSLVSARTRRVLLDTLRTKPVRFVALAIVNFLVLDVLIALRPGFAVQAACVMSVTALIWFVILRANPVRNATWQDPLTGLADGTLLRDRLARAVARADAGARGVVLVVANLDDFRKINERYGDGAGDDILRGVAWRLLKDTRKCDTVVRLGADEFAVWRRESVIHPLHSRSPRVCSRHYRGHIRSMARPFGAMRASEPR